MEVHSQRIEPLNSVVYNMTTDQVPEYKGRNVIVRSLFPVEIVRSLAVTGSDNVRFVQLLSPDLDAGSQLALANWDLAIPLDIVISDPAVDFPLLYNFSKLIDKYPIRVTIAARPGFIKAVKLALALNFTVKLDVGQPDVAVIEELKEVLDLYLHRPDISQPVEYFHSVFLSFYHQRPVNIWILQEDDPEHFRFVTDDGIETLSPRFAGADVTSVTNSHGCAECASCEFAATCGGYFKWPDPEYDCDGVRSIFAAIGGAAAELKETVDKMSASQGVS